MTTNIYTFLIFYQLFQVLGGSYSSSHEAHDENTSQTVPEVFEDQVGVTRADSDGDDFSHEYDRIMKRLQLVTHQPLLTDKDPKKLSYPNTDETSESFSGENENHPSALAINANPYEDPQYISEIKAGDMADLFGPGKHKYVPPHYKEFARRFVLQYPYTDKKSSNIEYEAEEQFDKAIKEALKEAEKVTDDELIPKKAPPEVVLAVAKQAAKLQAAQPVNPADDVMTKDILRSGDYWNGVWKEDVKVPSKILRSNKKQLESVRVNIMPGSELHRLVSIMTKISPKLLYIINKY